ncbi:MAG: class I adenylate-forming enzyme family protein [Actinomycetota bacterium]|jgi:acyl-CoA synthetase (AMP-forming)/AMP-acid ligase II|nr:class I adenylate-forming enzyme family protein [Actinomycetota bacterium]
MLSQTVTEAAQRFGSRPALVAEEGWSLGFDDLARLSDEVAAGLAERGVHQGDVVALVLPASPEHFVVYAAVAKLGGITAAVNPRLSPVEQRKVLASLFPRWIVSTPALAETFGATLDTGRVVLVEPATSATSMLEEVRACGGVPPLADEPDRPVVIVCTSGTTGTPKGAVFASRQLEFITETDVGPAWGGGGPVLAGPALAHLGPMTKWAGNLRRGATLYVSGSWTAAGALRQMAELGVTVLGGVPTQLALMLREPDLGRYDLSRLRAIVIGGGPAPPALVREARQQFNVPLAVRFSCTEAGIGTGTAFDDPLEDAELSVGRPQPGVSLRIVDAHGDPLPPGEVGEVVLSSPAVMSGYWRAPEATAAALVDDGVRTGDLGWVDERGRLRLAGRATERIVRGGNNIHPIEVEAVLSDHPDVAAAALVGRADPVMGEVGVAVVVPRSGCPAPTLDRLRSFAAERLARYKLPDDLLVVDRLPLTAMDKVDRRALEDMVASPSSTSGPGPEGGPGAGAEPDAE